MYKPISDLPNEDKGMLLDAIFMYQINGEIKQDLSPSAQMAFNFFKNRFEIDKKKYRSDSNHWNWKGGITDTNIKIRNSKKYKYWRESVFQRDGYICQKCFEYGGKLNAHHIKMFSTHKELRFDINNGITLCKKCHIEVHKTNK